MAAVTRFLSFLLVVSAALVIGCSSGNHLIGTWVNDSGKFDQTLREDGTITVHYESQGSQVTVNGTYSYTGNQLTTTAKSIEVTGGPNPAETKALLTRQQSKPSTTPLEWQDNDHFSIGGSPDAGGIALHRKQ